MGQFLSHCGSICCDLCFFLFLFFSLIFQNQVAAGNVIQQIKKESLTAKKKKKKKTRMNERVKIKQLTVITTLTVPSAMNGWAILAIFFLDDATFCRKRFPLSTNILLHS